jgi:ABC-type Na+ efflux pump permease subunit
MKKFYFLLLAFFIFSGVNAQIIEFKSPTFKERLLIANTDNDIAKDLLGNSIKIDENNDKEIQLEEALKISALDLKSTPIYDISGIEFFTVEIFRLCLEFNKNFRCQFT